MPGRGTRGRLILGILAAVPEGYRGRRPFGPQTISFRAVAAAAREAGLDCVVFTPGGWRPGSARVSCWCWERGAWRPTGCCLPHAVYNRVPRRSLERRPEVRRTLAALAAAGVPVFNPGFLDKAVLYAALAADPQSAPWLAPVERVEGAQDLWAALARWGRGVLKPRDGSLGRGVLFLAARPGGVLCVPGSRQGGPRGRYRAASRLAAAVPGLGRPGHWLLQRYVERLTVGGRPCDVRALVQRLPRAGWSVTGMAARLAGRGRLVTHVPQGGSRLPLERALAGLPRAAVAAARQALVDASLAAARAVERQLGGIWAELSVDLAVEPSGRVWLLECNAKPMRFDEPEIRRRHLRRLARFARAVAGGWRPRSEPLPGEGAVAGD